MKRFLYTIFLGIILLSLTACGSKAEITGIWEQEMETSILGEGIEAATSVASLRRFTFREGGTGLQEHILLDETYPDAVREFTWQLEDNRLMLEYEENHTEEFSVIVSKNSLKLENPRGTYDLLRIE